MESNVYVVISITKSGNHISGCNYITPTEQRQHMQYTHHSCEECHYVYRTKAVQLIMAMFPSTQ